MTSKSVNKHATVHHLINKRAATNMGLASCGVKCLNSSSVFQINFSAGLTVWCSEIPHERQAQSLTRNPRSQASSFGFISQTPESFSQSVSTVALDQILSCPSSCRTCPWAACNKTLNKIWLQKKCSYFF